jgi:SPP1 gp7 family putative phage head morphogenesis protein
MPGATSLTVAPQGANAPYFGRVSPLQQQLADPTQGYGYSYGPGFLPRQPPTFTQGAFGPFSPILPVPVDQPAPGADMPDARREQYTVGWNLPVGQPGAEGIKLADFGTLKTLADLYSVARACIELRKNELAGLDWDIVPTKDAAKAYNGSIRMMKDFGDRRGQAMKFFARPDPDYISFQSLMTALLEEIFVFDALSLLIRPKRGKGLRRGVLGSDLDCLELISGPTMRPLYGVHGETPRPPNPAYQQYLYGVPRSDYMTMITERDIVEGGLTDAEVNSWTTDQFLYLPMVPRRWTPYGFPPVERALVPIMSGLQKQAYQLDYFKEGCYDTSTDILTRRGWLPFAKLEDNDEVATRSESGQFEWQKPTARLEYQFDGEMIEFANKSVDLLVTPGHRMLVRRPDGYLAKHAPADGQTGWHVRLAEHIARAPETRWAVPATSRWSGSGPREFVLPAPTGRQREFRLAMRPYCEFLGLFLAEGWVQDRAATGRRDVVVYVSQRPASRHLPDIRRILAATGLNWSYDEKSGKFSTCCAALGRWLKTHCGHLAENKRVPAGFKDLPAECLDAMLNGMMLGDGHWGPQGQRYYTTSSEVLADDVQEIFQKLGRDAWIRRSDTTGYKGSFSTRPVFVVRERMQADHWLPVPARREYHGTVSCVTVPNGIVYVRRNGRAVWCGNTIPAVYISPGDVNMTPNQIRELQDALNAFAGDPAWHHKVIVLPPGSKVDPQKSVDVADQFDDVVMTQTCMAFDVNPMELGILPKVTATASPGMIKQMAQGAASVHERLSTKPTLKFLANIFDTILHNVLHQDDMKFTFEGLQEDAEQGMLTDLLIQQVQSGIRSVDEARDQLELQPWGLPMTSGPVVFTAAGPMPFDMPPLPATQGQAQGGAQDATRRAPTAGPAPLQQAGRQGGQPSPTPGHAAASAANASSRSGRAPSVSAPTSGSVSAAKYAPAAVTSELSALCRHLNKGRRISTWHPVHIPPHAMAVISEDLSKGLTPGQCTDIARTILLGSGDYEWLPKEEARRSAPWENLSATYSPLIEAAFQGAITEISHLIRDWWSGQVVLTRNGLIDAVRAVLQAALEPVLADLWADAWRQNDRTAGGLFQAWLASSGRDTLEQIAGSRLRKVNTAISDAVQSGRGPDQVISQLPDLLDIANRSQVIAVTEMGRAATDAAIRRYRVQGTTYKEWWTANDARVCAKCLAAQDEGPVPLDSLFGNGLMGPPGHPRCRCDLVPSVTHGVALKQESVHPGEKDITCGRGHTHHGEFGAAGLLIRHKGDDGKTRYLLQKRSPEEDDPGTWSLPGGAKLAGETTEQAAFREAQEEMGALPPGVTVHHHVVDDHGENSDGQNWSWTTLVCDVPEQFAPPVDGETAFETSGWAWFTREEIADLPLHPGFAESWQSVIRTRKNTELGKCVMRRVNLDGQEFWSSPDPCPCHDGDRAAGGGGPEFMPHDADGIQDGRASGSRGGGTAGHSDDMGSVRPGNPSPEWEDDSEYPQSRGIPGHREGTLQGYQGGFWPQGGHGTGQSPVTSAGGRNAVAPGNGKLKMDAGNKVSEVFAQLEGNFPDDAIQWVKECYWTGPQDVPLDEIDWRDHKEWAAWHEQDHVEDFKRKLQAGESVHPPVLIHHPGKRAAVIIDGHHRSMAYEQLGMPVHGWLGEIPGHFIQAALETHSSQSSQGDAKGNE